MKILLVEPFFSGSHRQWATGWQQSSRHDITLLTLAGYHWKWRMHGGAVTLASRFNDLSSKDFDVIVATDMLDVALFRSLTVRHTAHIPIVVYFHENQLTYPWRASDVDVMLKRDNHYAFINYSSALAADVVLFNSVYHQRSFVEALPEFLRQFPDFENFETVEAIAAKSKVLALGLKLQRLNELKPATIEKYPRCLILWNHRWEYDKNAEQFFETLFKLHEHGIDFRLAVLGESFSNVPPIFEKAKEVLVEKIVHWGYVESEKDYAEWLWKADLLPVTSKQDFFGASVVEAMYCNVVPFLPKRLAYMEHIPEMYSATFFYDEADFAAKLQKRIMDVKYLRAMNTQQWVEKYDWKNAIAMYDDLMETIVEQWAK